MHTTVARGTSLDKSEFTIRVYDKSNIAPVIDEVRELIANVLEESEGMISSPHLELSILDGAVVFAAEKNDKIVVLLIVEVFQYSAYRIARVLACCGKNLDRATEELRKVMIPWAISRGCVEFEGWCKPSFTPLYSKLGWEVKRHVVSYDLRSKLQ